MANFDRIQCDISGTEIYVRQERAILVTRSKIQIGFRARPAQRCNTFVPLA